MAVSNSKQRNQPNRDISESDLAHQSQQLGWFGSIFGSKENAPIYIAGVLAFLALTGLISVGIFASESPEKPDLLKTLGSIVLASLTFIGGAASTKRNE